MIWKKRTYLDFAAGKEGNPSSAHAEGRKMKARLEDARVEIARLVECKADDVVFTSGATEANALAILGILNPGDHALYLPSAHASIVENMKIAEARGAIIEPLIIKNGEVDLDALKKQVKPETALVSMEAVCGETGTIWNTHEIANTLKMHQFLRFHIDASQAPFTEKITRSHFGADLLVLDGGKLGAPGAGALIAHRTIPLAPLYGGGGQERGLRSGTENVEAIGKFARELARATGKREEFKTRAAERRVELLQAISTIPDLEVNIGREGVPQIVNISLPGRDTDYLVALLDEGGFAVSTRSACETDSEEGSRAVYALTGDPERASATLRISYDSSVSSRDLARFAHALAGAVAFVDSARGRAHH